MTSSPESKSFESPYFQFVHVYKAFDEQPVLEDVNFDVRRGEMVVVLGKSGVGKSVTLKHIMGFLQPDTGQVFVAGREISKLPEEELFEVRRRVTMVFQSGALFDSLTVGENVAYPLRERAEYGLVVDEDRIQARVGELLAMVELDGVRDLMPSDLSTGMKRAVAIARALAAKPEALLYDEPTTMVDPLMAQTIADLILKLKRQAGLTSVVVTHDMKLARKLADRLVFLVDGRVAFFGSSKELDASPEPIIRDFIRLDEVSFLQDSRESRVESRESKTGRVFRIFENDTHRERGFGLSTLDFRLSTLNYALPQPIRGRKPAGLGPLGGGARARDARAERGSRLHAAAHCGAGPGAGRLAGRHARLHGLHANSLDQIGECISGKRRAWVCRAIKP